MGNRRGRSSVGSARPRRSGADCGEVESQVGVGRVWEWLCLPIVAGAGLWLRAGVRRGWRRKLLAASLKEFGAARFSFSPCKVRRTSNVFGPAARLGRRMRFAPDLGPGIYAWRRLSDARESRRMLLRFGGDFRILRFAVPRRRLLALRTIDVDQLDDPEAWMRRHSLLWTDAPADHGRITSAGAPPYRAGMKRLSSTSFPLRSFAVFAIGGAWPVPTNHRYRLLKGASWGIAIDLRAEASSLTSDPPPRR